MLIEILRVTLIGALPVFLLSYVVLSKAFSSDKYDRKKRKRAKNDAQSDMSESTEQSLEKAQPSGQFNIGERAMDKWLFFGGGFYGTMAFATFLAIEFGQIVGFFGKLLDLTLSQVFSKIGIDLLVKFFIDAIMNMVDAFIWFIYWPKHIDMQNGWVWLIASYIAFTLAARCAEKLPASVLIKTTLARFSKNEPQA